jgi:amino acid transporter
MEREYSTGDQTFYLIELTVFVAVLLIAGYRLLGSTRLKDQPYLWYGWVFYALAFLLIALMYAMVTFYR